MKTFTIEPNDYLARTIKGFYNSDYKGGGNWKKSGTIENLITTLKNDITPYPEYILNRAVARLKKILVSDIPSIREITNIKPLTICVVPRAKVKYKNNQLLFKRTISNIIHPNSPNYENGTDFIIRKKDTRTTHRNRSGYGGDGPMPYPGITKDTCEISQNVYGKDILLIDDLYTKTVNIDEDAIQALYDYGANSVIFYSLGKTVSRDFIFNFDDIITL